MRSYVQCKTCRRVAYYDYVPYSLSTPIMVMPCTCDVGVPFRAGVRKITEKQFHKLAKET